VIYDGIVKMPSAWQGQVPWPKPDSALLVWERAGDDEERKGAMRDKKELEAAWIIRCWEEMPQEKMYAAGLYVSWKVERMTQKADVVKGKRR
jgi:hypothetical protein